MFDIILAIGVVLLSIGAGITGYQWSEKVTGKRLRKIAFLSCFPGSVLIIIGLPGLYINYSKIEPEDYGVHQAIENVISFIAGLLITFAVVFFVRRLFQRGIKEIVKKGGQIDWGSYYFNLCLVYVSLAALIVPAVMLFWEWLQDRL